MFLQSKECRRSVDYQTRNYSSAFSNLIIIIIGLLTIPSHHIVPRWIYDGFVLSIFWWKVNTDHYCILCDDRWKTRVWLS